MHLLPQAAAGRPLAWGFTTRHGGVSRGPFATLNLGRRPPGPTKLAGGVIAGGALELASSGVSAAVGVAVGPAAVGPAAEGVGTGAAADGAAFDDPAAVDENRRRLVLAASQAAGAASRRLAGDPLARWISLHQVHGCGVVGLDEPPAGAPVPIAGPATSALPARPAPVAGDIIACSSPGWLIAVLVADCAPILLIDAVAGVAVTAHAGWRGTAAGVARAAVDAAVARGARPARLQAAIGPAIGPCCFAVGAAVYQELWQALGTVAPAAFPPTGQHVDLWAANAAVLAGCGLARERIAIVRHCTRCRPSDYFSHRGSGGLTGRQAGFVWTG